MKVFFFLRDEFVFGCVMLALVMIQKHGIQNAGSVPCKNRGICIFSVAAELLGSVFFALGSNCQHCRAR